MTTIAAITFDLDDTLWPIEPTIRRAEQALHDWLCVNCPDLTVAQNEMAQLRQDVINRNPHLAHDFSALRKAALRDVLLPAGYGEPEVDAGFDVFFAARHEVSLFADALEALERLSGRFRLAAISNGNAQLDRVGLASYFEFAVHSRAIGQRKPHPAIFQAASQRLELEPAQILHVGDHPEEDIDGALAAGMHAVWLDRSDDATPHPRATATVNSLQQLEAVINTLK